MTKELTVIDYKNPEIIRELKKTVAQGATDEEFLMFAELCRSTGLNPYKREIWFIKTQGFTKSNGEVVEGKAQIMTGVNGFYAIANSHPEFDGIEIIESENQITIDKVTTTDWKGNQTVKEVNPAVVVPEYIEAKVWRKDRKFPSTARAKWAEYGKDLITPKGKRSIWGQMPSIMLAKCAESLALRKAFPQEMNGLYTQEEMPAEFSVTVEPEAKPANPVLASLKTADEIVQNIPQHEQKVGFGKHKDKTWAELSNEYLNWLLDKADTKYRNMALDEIDRRMMDQGKDVFGDDDINMDAQINQEVA